MHEAHKRKNIIRFREGVSIVDLVNFYNNSKFNDGKPLYDISGEVPQTQMDTMGVVFVVVPDAVRQYWASHDWQGKMPNELPVATDMLVTLADLCDIGKVDDKEYLQKATRKTLGSSDHYLAHQTVRAYLETFPHLLMTHSDQPISAGPPFTDFKPDMQMLERYQAIGIVPAPVVNRNGTVEGRAMSWNIPHTIMLGIMLGSKEQYALENRASTKAVKRLYAPFIANPSV